MSNTSSPSPPPKDSKSDKDSTHGKSTPPANSKSSPPGDDSSNKTPPSPPESPEKSPPSPTSTKTSSSATASPPQSSLPPSPPWSPPTSPPQSPPPPPSPSKDESPPSPSPPPPNKQPPSPPPQSPPKEQSTPLPSTGDSTQSSPEKSPPPPPLSPPPSSTTSPPPPPSETLSSLGSSPPIPKVFTKSSAPELSPDALAPRAVPSPPPHSSSNAGGGPSSPSGGSDNNNSNDVKNPRRGVIVDATVAGGIVLVAFVLLFFFIKKKREKKQPTLPGNHAPPSPNIEVKSDAAYYKSQGKESTLVNSSETPRGPNYHGPESGIIAGSKTFFTYEELMEMTDGFARENIIGEGGFGCVYKGRIPDGRLVAVKQLKVGSGQGEREFKAEVEIISRIHHRHLVSLVGYCIAENQRLLIYDFVKNKTLEHHLHGKELPVLEWANRVKIAIGAARGLAYLHEDCQPRIIHRDIKSANILLEDDFEAQVADFGLARLNDTSQTHVSTRVMGTFGYLAPEYASSGKLTDRSDVFSFGVVLLELITGQKPVDPTRPLGDESLVEWARPVLIKALESGDISEIIDPRLEKRYVESEVLIMIESAAACVRHSAAKRPRMALVVRALDFEGSDLSNGVKVGQSIAYDSGKYSEEIAEFRRMALESFGSESDMYSEEFNSREILSQGQPSWKSEYSSSEYTSGESEIQPFKKSGSGYSAGGASGNYSSVR